VTGADDALVKTWGARTGHLKQMLAGHGALVNSVTFSLDGQTLLSASDDGTIRFWNARSGAWQGALRTLPAGLNSWIAWTRDGFYDGSQNAEAFVRWNDGKNLLPTAALKRRRAGVLRELLGAR
jgi:WD40 repeat protein